MGNTLSVLDVYMNRVFKTLIIGIPIIGLCAGVTFSVIKILGFYPDVALDALLIFDSTCLLYFALGLLFVFNCQTKSGLLRSDAVFWGKVFIAIVELLQ